MKNKKFQSRTERYFLSLQMEANITSLSKSMSIWSNKKAEGQDILTGTVMFLVLNVVFFSILFFYVGRAGTGADVTEQLYAKKVAIFIDSLNSGSEATMDFSELYKEAAKNNYNGEILVLDSAKNKVTIRVTAGEGHSYYYFTDLEGALISLDKKTESLTIKT